MNLLLTTVISQKHIAESDSVYKLNIGSEEIYVTGEHPFYIENEGWVRVKDLEIGNVFLSISEERMILKSKEIICWKNKVYNLEVGGFHNYFITKNKILVHNK